MNPQEKELLTTLLDRVKNAPRQDKDPEADALIRQAMAAQPDLPYYLTQTVLIQDLSLHQAQQRIADLEKQLADAQQAAKPTVGSFLGGLFGSRPPAQASGPAQTSAPQAGPWTRSPQVAAAPPAQPYGQPGYAPQPGYGHSPMGGGFMGGGMGGAGGGFLRSAAATAAGVAGGALLFQGISSLFGNHYAGGLMSGGMTPGLGETVVNNYYGSDAGGVAAIGAATPAGPVVAATGAAMPARPAAVATGAAMLAQVATIRAARISARIRTGAAAVATGAAATATPRADCVPAYLTLAHARARVRLG